MAKLRFTITMSIDGYVAGPDQSLEHGLGVGGDALHDWPPPRAASCGPTWARCWP